MKLFLFLSEFLFYYVYSVTLQMPPVRLDNISGTLILINVCAYKTYNMELAVYFDFMLIL